MCTSIRSPRSAAAHAPGISACRGVGGCRHSTQAGHGLTVVCALTLAWTLGAAGQARAGVSPWLTVQGLTDSSIIEDASETQAGQAHVWRFPVETLDQPLAELQIQLVMSHDAAGDLDIHLIAPDGTRLALVSQLGARLGAPASRAGLQGNYLFDDGGADLWQAAASAGVGLIEQGRSYRTSSAGHTSGGGCHTWLQSVFGMLPASDLRGTWRIETVDSRPGGTGGYTDAVLRLRERPIVTPAVFADGFESSPTQIDPVALAGDTPRCRRSPRFDLDGNGYSDFLLVRPTATAAGDVLRWHYRLNAGLGVANQRTFDLGRPGDTFAGGDFDGDGIWDAAVFRPGGSGRYLIRPSSNPARTLEVEFGGVGDARHQGDFDGDGVDDFGQYEVGSGPSSNGRFIVRDGRTGSQRVLALSIFYTSQVIAGPDYTGDGAGDQLQRILDTLSIRNGQTGVLGPPLVLGQNNDLMVPGSFGGDARADVMLTGPGRVFADLRRWEGISAEGLSIDVLFGRMVDTPAPADYDGDGHEDIAVFYQESGDSGAFRLLPSSAPQAGERTVPMGRLGDLVPAAARLH